jgi:hypothetical protein
MDDPKLRFCTGIEAPAGYHTRTLRAALIDHHMGLYSEFPLVALARRTIPFRRHVRCSAREKEIHASSCCSYCLSMLQCSCMRFSEKATHTLITAACTPS